MIRLAWTEGRGDSPLVVRRQVRVIGHNPCSHAMNDLARQPMKEETWQG